MMNLGLLLGVICVFFVEIVQPAAVTSTTEDGARTYVKHVNQVMFGLYEQIYQITFGKEPSEYQTDIKKLGEIADTIANITKRAQQYPLKNIQDEELKTSLINIKRSAYLYILGSKYFEQVELFIAMLKLTLTQKTLCDFKDTKKCNLAYVPDVRRIIYNAHDNEEELKHYWSTWRDGNFAGKHIFKQYVDLLKTAASETGVTPVEFLYNIYGDASFGEGMKKVMDQIHPMYKKFHAYVRYELNKKFGDSVVSKAGPLPHHLFEMIVTQAWKKDSVLEQWYPEKRLPNLQAGLEKGFDVDRIIEVAKNYYESLGLTPLPEKIISNFNLLPASRIVGDCKATIYDQTPDIRMEYCPQTHFKRFLQMHGYLGQIYYANEKHDLPFAFYNSYNFEEAVGETGILSASSPAHISRLGIVSQVRYTPEIEMNRLFRMGVHTWFNIPVYYVHVKLMEDLLTGVTTYDNINSHYWKLMEEYVGVEPPVDRNTGSFDLPYKFYEDLKGNHQVTKFVSEILGYQLYERLCKKSGLYVAGSQDKQLHDCNFGGHREAGDALKEMMVLGSKQPWNKVLSKVTGNELGLQGDGLLEYYKPLKSWLDEKITKNEIPHGWETTKKEINKPGGANPGMLLFAGMLSNLANNPGSDKSPFNPSHDMAQGLGALFKDADSKTMNAGQDINNAFAGLFEGLSTKDSSDTKFGHGSSINFDDMRRLTEASSQQFSNI